MTNTIIKAPSRLLFWLENPRAIHALNTLPYSLPLLSQAARGKGQPIIVIPGLMAGDLTTLPLRTYLKYLGYDVHGWGLGLNRGRKIDPEKGIPEDSQLLAQIQRVSAETNQPVTLIGWSLGGHYARVLAHLAPEQIRMVITLATPFNGDYRASNVWNLFEKVSGFSFDDISAELTDMLQSHPPVPTTAIYSQTDGIAAWQNQVQTEDGNPNIENIEVTSSHNGIGFHPAVFWAIADRLAQPTDSWQPFKPRGWKKKLYQNFYQRKEMISPS